MDRWRWINGRMMDRWIIDGWMIWSYRMNRNLQAKCKEARKGIPAA